MAHKPALKEIQNDTSGETAADHGSIPCKITYKGATDSVTFALPRKWAAGMTIDNDNTAKCIDAHCAGSFASMLGARAKARVEALAQATTDEERAKNAPYSEAEVMAEWAAYVPAFRDGTSAPSETLRERAAWNVFLGRVEEHNKRIAAGHPGLFKGEAATKPYVVRLRNSTDAQKAEKASIISAYLNAPSYADRIQAELDSLIAASKKATGSVVSVASDDLL